MLDQPNGETCWPLVASSFLRAGFVRRQEAQLEAAIESPVRGYPLVTKLTGLADRLLTSRYRCSPEKKKVALRVLAMSEASRAIPVRPS
jgi:hypothetical protein